MKVRRYKRVQRLLTFYRSNFGFAKPFQVLADGTFCLAALENRINLREQLPHYLNDEVHLLTTPCVLKELECLGSAVYGALHIARQLSVEPCGHTVARTASKCVANLQRRAVSAPSSGDAGRRFFVGTQDRQLTETLREIAGTPVLFIKFNALLLEKPSDTSIKAADDAARLSDVQRQHLRALKTETGLADGEPVRKRRKIRGPNPMSCKRKKTKPSAKSNPTAGKTNDADGTPTEAVKRRKRRRKKRNADAAVELTG